MQKNRKQILELADSLGRQLINLGFTVHRYDSYSSNSVYLKLDCGVCYSIRISDHEGKGYLKYRYNIGTHIKCSKEEYYNYQQYRYPINCAHQLLQRIMIDKKERLDQYGAKIYAVYMRENEMKGKKQKGFWQQAVKIVKEI